LAVILSDLSVRTLTIADKANDRARALDVARDLVSDLAHVVALALTLARHRALARDVAHVRGLARHLASTRDLGLARYLARQTTLMVGDVLGLRQVEGLATALLEGALDDFTHADLSLTELGRV
jgi:hypothetical protein